MKIRLLIIFVLVFAASIKAQIKDPIKWNTQVKKIGINEYDLIFNAKIEDKWHLYSQNIKNGGPVPTSFNFKKNSSFKTIGKVVEIGKIIKENDPNFDMVLSFFAHKVTFKQRVKIIKPISKIECEVTFMACDDKQCMPPEYKDFSFNVEYVANKEDSQENDKKPDAPLTISFDTKADKNGIIEVTLTANLEDKWSIYSQNTELKNKNIASSFKLLNNEEDFEIIGKTKEEGSTKVTKYDEKFKKELTSYTKKVSFIQKIKLKKRIEVIEGKFSFLAHKGKEFLPIQTKEFKIEIPEEVLSKIDFEENETIIESEEDAPRTTEGKSGWGIFIAGFIGGLIALLTPCVFPMIPLTVSFFTKKGSSKGKGVSQAMIYGFSIIAIFVLLGFGVTKIAGPDAMNAMASSALFNLLFFVLFVVFAASFFGAFEITLPSNWINKSDEKAEKGGIIGIFFMAFTLVLVSFSCTGPIIGTLLVEAALNGATLAPLLGMLGFSTALAIPFTLFAIFPSWLNSLPQSGGWLNSVKVVLGFLELALSMKFLSNVDLAYHWGILTREIFLAIWFVIFTLLGMYLIGKLKFQHDSDLNYISIPRLMFAILSFSFAIYLLPGMWGAPVKLTSGLAPPSHYKEWHIENKSKNEGELVKGMENGPHGIKIFKNYELGLKYAKKVNKPIMIDFTGYTCVNCRKMEDNVWILSNIKPLISEEYVLISLYVDDKKLLPEKEQYISETTGKKVKTIGNKWSDLEASKYGRNTQPFYVLQDHQGNLLTKPRGYTPDEEVYEKFLRKGIKEFKKKKSEH